VYVKIKGHMRIQQAVGQARKRAFIRNQIYHHLGLEVPAPRTVRK
jgi:hypothetical protein